MNKGESVLRVLINQQLTEKYRAEHVRITCDYMNATFLLDEHTDVSEERVFREQNNIVMDVLHNPHQPRPEGEWIGGEIMRQWVPFI
jgi:hypothetical protein